MKKFGRSEAGGATVRNGFSRERTLLTGIGPINVKQPRVDDRKVREDGGEGFSSLAFSQVRQKFTESRYGQSGTVPSWDIDEGNGIGIGRIGWAERGQFERISDSKIDDEISGRI